MRDLGHADTERANGAASCAAGQRALDLLVGDPSDPETPSVFARLGSIERKIGWIGILVCAPLWVLAGLAVLERLQR